MLSRHKISRVAPLILILLALVLLTPVLLAGCGQAATPATSLRPTATATSSPVPATVAQSTPEPTLSPTLTPAPTLTPETASGGLAVQEAAILSSLEEVDGYPLYTMHYEGEYPEDARQSQGAYPASSTLPWACSLFATPGDEGAQLYGRNFDWQFSPALLLFTDPPDGYASVSMVDIAYLGFEGARSRGLLDLPLEERVGLLQAPHWPFDGMNEQGLAVGMAAVPPGGLAPDPAKPTLGSLGIIRRILDQAGDVEEALSIFRAHNVEFGGGPPLHYLLSDRSGRAVLVEFYRGEMVVLPNARPWHLATNFLRSSVDAPPGQPARGHCWRYDRIEDTLSQAGGRLSQDEALDLLAQVAQDGTQWSVVYDQHSGDVLVAMGKEYDDAHTLHLPLDPEP